jgi:hypothetical protein
VYFYSGGKGTFCAYSLGMFPGGLNIATPYQRLPSSDRARPIPISDDCQTN